MNHKLSYSHVYFTVNVHIPKGKSGECTDIFVNVSGSCAYTSPGFSHPFDHRFGITVSQCDKLLCSQIFFFVVCLLFLFVQINFNFILLS